MVAKGWRFLAWLALLEGLWAVYVGTFQSTELVAGAIAAVPGALFAEALRACGLLDLRPASRVVRRAWRIPGQVVFDLGLVYVVLLRELLHGRRVRGRWVDIAYHVEPGAVGRFQRALALTLENGTPNGIVVDIVRDRALLHSLDAGVSTGHTVL